MLVVLQTETSMWIGRRTFFGKTTPLASAIWLMNRTTFQSIVSFATVGTSWSIAGLGHFNGDGKADILWQDNLTGQRLILIMNGTTFQFCRFGNGRDIVEHCWFGDFNGDGKADILWQNNSLASALSGS